MRARAIVLPSVAIVAILAVPGIGIAIAAQTDPRPVPQSPALVTSHGRTFDPANVQDMQELNRERMTQFPPCSDHPRPTITGTATAGITICMRSNPPSVPSGTG
jgi:hypothetical protein